MAAATVPAPARARRGNRRRRLAGEAALAAALLGLSLLAEAYPLGLVPGVPARDRLLWFFSSEQRWHLLVGCWWAASLAAVIALLLRHRWPAPAFAVAVLAAGWHLGDAWFGASPVDLAAAITLYGAAVAAPTVRRSAAVLAAGVLGCGGLAFAWQAVFMPSWERAPLSVVGGWPVWANDALLPVVALVPAWLAARARRSELALLDERAHHLDREHAQRAALAAAAERSRISREVHDVVGHSLSVMVIQAQAAAGVLERDPDAARQVLDQVVTVGQRALTEVRGLLGVLRAGADPAAGEAAALAPAAGLARLPELADRVREAGVPTRVHVSPGLPRLPAVVDLSAYRIAQEALTNTIKHAGAGATATVSVSHDDTAVLIEVVDTGRGPGAGPRGDGFAPGNGLRGVTERALALGGTADAGPLPDGGFRVWARLPLPGAGG